MLIRIATVGSATSLARLGVQVAPGLYNHTVTSVASVLIIMGTGSMFTNLVKIGRLLLLGLFLCGVGLAHGEEIFGQGASFEKVRPISEVLANPQKFVVEEVTVAGTVTEVCANRGCWMKLASDKKFQNITIKVNDGEIVFPLLARGKKAAARGKIQIIELSHEQAVAYYRHRAEENKLPFDPASVKGPETVYQLRAVGAVMR